MRTLICDCMRRNKVWYEITVSFWLASKSKIDIDVVKLCSAAKCIAKSDQKARKMETFKNEIERISVSIKFWSTFEVSTIHIWKGEVQTSVWIRLQNNNQLRHRITRNLRIIYGKGAPSHSYRTAWIGELKSEHHNTRSMVSPSRKYEFSSWLCRSQESH